MTGFTQEYDVVIVGGGLSGAMAAIAAGRNGARTLLVERNANLGGIIASGLVGPLQTFHTAGEQLITGLPEEMVQRLIKRGWSPGHVYDMTGFVPTVTPVCAEGVKLILEEMALEAGVDLGFHLTLVDVEKNGQEIESLVLHSKNGFQEVKGQSYTDATGDGQLLYLAGADYEVGRERDQRPQAMTLMFQVGGVDLRDVREYIKNHPEDMVLAEKTMGLEPWEFPYICACGFFSKIAEAKDKGEYSLPRDRVLFFELPYPGEVTVNMTRVIDYDPLNVKELARAEVAGRKQVSEALAFLRKYIPGFTHSYLRIIGAHIGIRESRRLVGAYKLTEKDLVEQVSFEDRVVRGFYPIDIHSPDSAGMNYTYLPSGASYTIPYRSLYTPAIKNLLVTGRCISVTHEALASIRVGPIVAALGQAAGTAAALATKENIFPVELSVAKLQTSLKRQGINIEGKGG